MKPTHFRAFTGQNKVSSNLETKQQAINWAAEQLSKPEVTSVTIYQATDTVERETPTIKVTELSTWPSVATRNDPRPEQEQEVTRRKTA